MIKSAVNNLVSALKRKGKLDEFISGCACYKKGCSGKQQEFGFAFQNILEQFVFENGILGYRDKGNDDTGDVEFEGASIELKTHKEARLGKEATFYSVNTSEDLLWSTAQKAPLTKDVILSRERFIANPNIQKIAGIGVLVLSYDYDYTKGQLLTIDINDVLPEIASIKEEHIESRERFRFYDKNNKRIGYLIRPYDSKNQERGLFFNIGKFTVLHSTDVVFNDDSVRYVLGLRASALIRKHHAMEGAA